MYNQIICPLYKQAAIEGMIARIGVLGVDKAVEELGNKGVLSCDRYNCAWYYPNERCCVGGND